jgi:glycosyltransferase involved in cell wall biosynthesis
VVGVGGTQLQPGRPRLLAVGPTLDHSSYARVVRETLKPLASRRTIRQFAPHHRGDAVDLGWPILSNRANADRYGVEQIGSIVASLDPDAIFIFNSFANLPRFAPLIGRFGSRRPRIADRTILARGADGGHPRLDDEALNRLYGACDVGLNTAAGEGWGMIALEHAATGAAQIVPGDWICGETWRGHAELLETVAEPPGPQSYTREFTVAPASVAAALERLYSDKAYCSGMAARAAALAGQSCFEWTAIADRWDALLRALCRTD